MIKIKPLKNSSYFEKLEIFKQNSLYDELNFIEYDYKFIDYPYLDNEIITFASKFYEDIQFEKMKIYLFVYSLYEDNKISRRANADYGLDDFKIEIPKNNYEIEIGINSFLKISCIDIIEIETFINTIRYLFNGYTANAFLILRKEDIKIRFEEIVLKKIFKEQMNRHGYITGVTIDLSYINNYLKSINSYFLYSYGGNDFGSFNFITNMLL